MKQQAPEPHARTPHERMFDATVRIEAMLPFPMHEAGEVMANLFEYQTRESLPSEIADLTKGMDQETFDALTGGEGRDFDEACEDLMADAFFNGVTGFIGEAATPVMTASPHGGMSYSWGHFHTMLIFAPTSEALIEKSIEWAREQYDKAMGAGA